MSELTGLSSILEKLSVDVAPQIKQALEDATEGRALVQVGDVEEGPADIHVQLVHNRRQIERLENITATLVLLKSRTSQVVAARKGAYDDAYMHAATKPTVGFGEYTSAKEKDANYNLSAIEEMIQLRKAEALHRDIESAWDYCRILLRGAEGAQRDLETRIRLISLTGALEK